MPFPVYHPDFFLNSFLHVTNPKVNYLAWPRGSTSLKCNKNLAWNRSIAVSLSNLVEVLPLLLLKSLLKLLKNFEPLGILSSASFLSIKSFSTSCSKEEHVCSGKILDFFYFKRV